MGAWRPAVPGWEMGRNGRFAWATAVVLAAACDIPTSAPIIDSRWIVPIQADSVLVVDLLPAGVTSDGDAFVIRAAQTEEQRTLRQLCQACPAGVAPKPAFEGTVTARSTLPGDVVRATLLAGAEIALLFFHDFRFDPIRPTATSRGQITVSIRSGGVTLATSTIDGNETDLPPGITYRRVVPLPGGTVIEGDVSIAVRVVSPAGGVTLLDPNHRVSVAVVPAGIRASAAVVRVESRTLSAIETDIDASGVSADLRSKIRRATLRLQVANPLAVSGDLTIRFLSSGTALIAPRTVSLEGGNQTVDIELSQADIDAVLAADQVRVEVAGRVSGSAADRLVTVTPRQVVRIVPRLILETRIGE